MKQGIGLLLLIAFIAMDKLRWFSELGLRWGTRIGFTVQRT
jgi:hypothetical protein